MTDPTVTALHSPWPPSSAARWAGQMCTASPALERQYESTEHAQAQAEGHAAHWVASVILLAAIPYVEGATAIPTVGTTAPNGLIVDEEMLEAAMMYVDDVREQMPDPKSWHVEEKVCAPSISPDNWGTPDAWAYVVPRLTIWDFKFGHRFVDAFENWQLMDYLAGVLSRPEFAGIDRRKMEIDLRVVQPRSYHPSGPIRSWRVDATTMAQFNTRLEAAVREGSTTPATRVGPQCQDCKARHACATLHNAADGVTDLAGGSVVFDLTPDALGVELRYLRRAQAMLDARVTGLEAQAVASIRAGQSVPFFTVGSTPGRAKWKVPVPEVIEMGKLMGVDLGKAVTSITPAQAIAAGLDEAIVKGYSERPPGALKLVAADTMQARKVFAK